MTKAGEGATQRPATYELEMLAPVLRAKQMLPYNFVIRARSSADSDGCARHAREEFVYVLSCVGRLYTEINEPVELRRGDSA